MSDRELFDFVALYNHQDAVGVQEICASIERHGPIAFVADKEILGGDDWHDRLKEVLRHTQVVVIFFGSHGPGGAQMEEEWKHVRAVKGSETKIIPVCINGASVPEEMGLKHLHPIDFPKGPEDPKNLDALYRAITRKTRKRDGEYSIHIAVRPDEALAGKRTCFLALSERTDAKLQDILVQSVQKTGRAHVAHSAGANAPGLEAATHVPDAIRAIRAASFVLADCSVRSPSDAPDPVAFALGKANAMGKPCVLVTNEPADRMALYAQIKPIIVGYDAAELDGAVPNDTSPLIDRLSKAISALLDRQRRPFLIDDDVDADIAVAFADVFHLRVGFWKRFREILHFGLEVDEIFTQSFVAFESVQRLVEAAYLEMTAPGDLKRPGASWRLFKDEHDRFQQVLDQQCKQRFNELSPHREKASAAFELLVDRTKGYAHKLLLTARDFFEVLDADITCFQRQCGALKALVEDLKLTVQAGGPTKQLHEQVTLVRTQVNALPLPIRGFREHCYGMKTGLLALIDQECIQGEERHAGAALRLS
ncbi:MAG TPA: toll/interleukin-1 receptor domain-containing protein [Planctomycetaceae bacterium]|jgi:hypothetical protein|nr:toll/interleukin-1 receptor domain-containing protein [Planctomycetaceae bacterium]